MAAVGAAVGAAGVAAVENEDYQRLFVTTFPGTVFLDPRTICSCFEINHVWKLSHKKVKDHVVRVVASLQLHSLQILSPTPVPGGQTGVYHANLEYEELPSNVTRITGADLVPQHAYYYLVMKIYELFLHPAASESMFRQDMEDIADFITEQLNSGLADGRAFFEDKVTRFLRSHPDFLQTTDAQELQNNINAIWDLLRSDEYKNAGNTVQKGIVSTISRHDVEEYSLEGQGTVSAEGADAFKKTVYGFHVLVYVGGHVISMSLSREDLFRAHRNVEVFSFFNSDMIKYMASIDFLKQVYAIIERYIKSNSNRHDELDGLESGYSDQCDLTVVECGCKSPVFVDDSTRPLTLTTNTKLPGRREYYGGVNASGNHYIFLDNFPSRVPMNTTLYVTSSERFADLPNFCEYDNIAAVNRVLGIEYGDSVGSLDTLRDSPPQSLGPEYYKKQADLALSIALQGASTVPVAASEAAVDAPGASAVEVAKPPGGLFVKVMSGVGAACNFIRGIFFPHTPTCSAEDYANIGFREHVVFCVPTKSEDIAIKGQSRPESTRWDVVKASVSWSEARALWLGVGGMAVNLGGGRRPVSRKYRNVKKNISRKKGKKRMSLRHRRSRRRLRRRSRSLCLKKLK
jgi:hypothetical protein